MALDRSLNGTRVGKSGLCCPQENATQSDYLSSPTSCGGFSDFVIEAPQVHRMARNKVVRKRRPQVHRMARNKVVRKRRRS